MVYATRPMHDADSHIMEPPGWLEGHLAEEFRARLPVMGAADAPSTQAFDIERLRRSHQNPESRAEDESQILLRKNFFATGSFIEDDRPRALDLLGFASQLVFDTFTSPNVLRIERDQDPALAVEIARGQRRAIVDWCSVDPRLLAVVVIPLGDMPAAIDLTREAIDAGAGALMIGQYCPPGHSPSHIALDPVWAMAAEAGVPIVLHVAGAGANVMNPAFFENGLPPVPDFHGGDGNFKSLDYLSIPLPVMQTLNALVIDGVLQRHPDLRVGVIEVGASWIPSWMRQLDSAHEAFRKNEERLQNMEMRPSEYVQRQVRATPYPHEDTGWTIANTGPSVCMFSSDFPHVEGGRNPIGRFERSMDAAATPDDDRRRFYWDNYVDLLRPVLERRGVATVAA